MKIALDWDGTFTADPKLWRKFITLCELAEHQIMIVTFRPDDCPIEWDNPTIPVFYTGAIPKKQFMEEQGIKIDIWIDDNPDLIVNTSEWTPLERMNWKKQNGFA